VPLVLLATAAAVIASQAVISGVFSMTQQALQLGFLPSVRIIQSSAEAMGQIYVPSVNWLLCLASIGLVIGFGSSESLANAYGIAVASTMVIETSLLLALLRGRTGWTNRALLYCLLPLALIDALFFASNAAKIPQGGWLPLLAALAVFYVMRTWTRGRVRVSELMRREGRSDAKFLAGIEAEPPARVPGLAVFLTSDATSVPRTLIRNVRHNGVLHKHTVLLTLKTESVPKIVRGGRATVTEIGHGIYRVVASIGFMDSPDVPRLLREAERRGLPFRTDDATFFLGREDIVIGARREMATWRKQLFMFMARNAQFAGERFGITPSRIVEIGGQVEL
jgi:KUP system potassium uptake protein